MINNLLTTTLMLTLLAIVRAIDIILGVIIANNKLEFDFKKFLKGIGKSLVILLCVLLFCICIELVPMVLARVGIQVPEDLVSVIEIILVTLTAFTKYATDCFDKFKIIINKEGE